MTRSSSKKSPSPAAPFENLGEDRLLDAALRPASFSEFVGQAKLIQNLKVAIGAALKRGDPLEHLLFSGPPGLGKTTLSTIIAHEMGASLRASSGPAMERAGDLVGVLSSLKRGDVLFLDEIHRLPAIVEEFLYSAMEDFSVDWVIDKGPSARSIKLPIEKFTLVGATTREGLLSSPLRSRFGLLERLDFYPAEDLVTIIERSARLLQVTLTPEASGLIARRARGTPRTANRFLRRVRDLAQVNGLRVVDEALAVDALERLGVDSFGLGELDRRILAALVRTGGEPVGLKTIAMTVGEEPDTLEEVYEPYLVQQGFLEKTPRGRRATDRAFEVLGAVRASDGGLFR